MTPQPKPWVDEVAWIFRPALLPGSGSQTAPAAGRCGRRKSSLWAKQLALSGKRMGPPTPNLESSLGNGTAQVKHVDQLSSRKWSFQLICAPVLSATACQRSHGSGMSHTDLAQILTSFQGKGRGIDYTKNNVWPYVFSQKHSGKLCNSLRRSCVGRMRSKTLS